MNGKKRGQMPRIIIGRYSSRGGTSSAPPVGQEWRGWIEPEDKSWIVFIAADGSPVFYGRREASGAVVEPDVGAMVNGRFVSAWGMGEAVVFRSLEATVAGVTFTDRGKVLYDLDLGDTRLERVDSAFVERPTMKAKIAEGQDFPIVETRPHGARGDYPERPWTRPLGSSLSYRRVGDLDVAVREQWDHQEPGMPWVAHEHYEASDGTTGCRRVAYGATEEEARERGEKVAGAYLWTTSVPLRAQTGS